MPNLEKYLNTRNYFVYKDFYKMIASMEGIARVAEVGTWKGHSISFLVKEMIKSGKSDMEVYAIDIWEEAEWPNADDEFLNNELPYMYDIYNLNLKRNNVRQHVQDIKKLSHEAADDFEDQYFDFVYLDADHREEAVIRDITAWKPKVRKGGILSGHDYYNAGSNKVKDVVDNFVEDGFLPPVKTFEGNVWYVEIV